MGNNEIKKVIDRIEGVVYEPIIQKENWFDKIINQLKYNYKNIKITRKNNIIEITK